MTNRAREPIAIVGSACRFAGGASTPSKLWSLLREPVDLCREIPPSRFNANGFYSPDAALHGHSNVRHAYFLEDDPATFDAEFFGVKPVEAKAIDPQQRFLMEVTYETLESAGIPLHTLRGSDTSVFAGIMFHDYGTMLVRDHQEIPTYYATGTGQSVVSNRISYFFDWHGPSVTVDTACSSSLVAVHLATQSLRSGESRMALACGTNMILGPDGFIIESKLQMLSPNGRSRMWDEKADGYARGEGVAAVALKTLSAALEDGDYIQCIIRETGSNQDGATPGITMPSAAAQEDLIRSTYQRAGLDLFKYSDRPQFFEAHGTGTPAGDPIEAEAIYKAFYTSSGKVLPDPLGLGSGHPLYVGSIKTVVGHTEGTAGVASLVKASLALQYGIMPPNLLFDQLSDRVAPFYDNLEILREAKPWPTIEGQPRRVSVNSFGFGGTNAHAILESYDESCSKYSGLLNFAPFVFSAGSEFALRESLAAFVSFLEESRHSNSPPSPQDLAWTLYSRRSIFRYRISFAESSLADLQVSIQAKLNENIDPTVGIGMTAPTSHLIGTRRRILGIFTGQGAQYPRMGAELIEKSPSVRKIIQQLESYLAEIPEVKDRPVWSLEAELLASKYSSRVHEAEFSQPLCTAVQICLVQLMEIADVRFSAVVGHSSGEIAAAYAAGYLSARHAMWIAYYRGLYASYSASPNSPSISGAMMAVGASADDIRELLADSLFAGRVSLAANNSSSSITLSGDEDAIAELELVLDDEDIFHRRLKVDKAYHSDHMLPCLESYKQSIRNLGIEPLNVPGQRCIWFSSLRDGQPVDDEIAQSIRDTYWPDNMTHPVLFFEALSSALKHSYDLILEVGSHPALAKPALQTVKQVFGSELPYHGILSRGSNAINAFSRTLGFLWSHLGSTVVNLGKYERTLNDFGNEHRFKIVQGLPIYQWNHQTRYWHESRSSRKVRNRPHSVHPLLGDTAPDSAPHHMIWRNLLRVSEMEWLSGHAVRGRIVYPAAAYLSTALEAARWIAADNNIRLIEMFDFIIHQALPFEQEDTGIEVLIEMSDISNCLKRTQNTIRARFTYSAAFNGQSDDLALTASANVLVHLGAPCPSLLPTRGPASPHMIDVEPERFYSALGALGYSFEGRFRALTELQRKRGRSSCLLRMQATDDHEYSRLIIHPAELDAAIQSSVLAYSYPYDEELRIMHLPTTFRQIRVNLAALLSTKSSRGDRDVLLPIDALIDLGVELVGERNLSSKVDGIVSDVSLYATSDTAYPHAAIQLHGACFKPLGGAAAEEDRSMYTNVHWVPYQPRGIEAAEKLWDEKLDHSTSELLERISTFYLRKFYYDVPTEHPAWKSFPTKWYLNYVKHMMEALENKTPKKTQWRNETIESLMAVSEPYMHLPDVQIMHLVGTQMPRVFEGETTMLEEFRADESNILDRYYSEGLGIHGLAKWVGRASKQLTDRNPHLNILEVGAGTGGATKAIFNEIGNSFLSYTYTDISTGFFENASELFSLYKKKMDFKTLDIEKDPIEQGFSKGAYDVIIAFFVIHATDLEPSLRNLRQLLKPGGLLILGEGCETGNGVTPTGFIFGTLPGWWVGAGKGRDLSPLLPPKEWDGHLRAAGFSGADTAPCITICDNFQVFPIVSQAVDDYVNFLREPLSSTALANCQVPPIQRLILVGGKSARSSHLIERLEAILYDFAVELLSVGTLEDRSLDFLNSTILSLTDLDTPIFKRITPERFQAYKDIFQAGNTILWVTSGRLCDEPFSNMSEAFARVATHEIPDLYIEHLDIGDPESIRAETIAEVLLRTHASVTTKRSTNDVSWVFEPEIAIDKSGSQLVPRTRFVEDLNGRYNAGRRPVMRKVCAHTHLTAITLQLGQEDSYILKESSPYETELPRNDSRNSLELYIRNAIISSIKTPFGFKFLLLGTHALTGVRYLTLASSLTSPLEVPFECAIRCDPDGPTDEVKLTTIASHLVCLMALDTICSGQAVVVHNAPDFVAEALAIQAAASNIEVIFVADTGSDVPPSWIKIPRYVGTGLNDIFAPPVSTSAFVGLSDHRIEQSENEAALIVRLQSQCHSVLTLQSLLSDVATDSSNVNVLRLLGLRLHDAVAYASREWKVSAHENASRSIPSVRLRDVVRGPRPINSFCVIDWEDTAILPVHATRLDASRIFKGSGSTYWIEGMSGALGISLVDWMIRKGARNIVITSRCPDIAPQWIASHKKRGATITVLACDVTNEEELRATYQKICYTLPPIMGVIHGAMVLRDVSLQSMSFQQLTDVLRPKVDGSIYLDRIFRETDLDFFVLTSSLNVVVGSKGQANYAAANAFMCSLARQRRKRGFRASVINGGAIIGAGYMERETRRAWDRVAAQHYMMRLSEGDFVQSICEAIHASRLDVDSGPEISMGLDIVPSTATNRPLWSFEPKHSVLVRHYQAVVENQNTGINTVSHVNYLQRLQSCTSPQEAYDIVKKAFANMLRGVLQVNSSDDTLMIATGTEIGLDSLISVDVRSWFLKTLQVGIPILKIMSNTSMAALVQLSVDSLPHEVAPKLDIPAIMKRNESFNHQAATSSSEVESEEIMETSATEDDFHLVQGLSDKEFHQAEIDWEAECCPSNDLLDLPPANEMLAPATPAITVVLTGATGLFGRNILMYLLEQTAVRKVICIAIRDLPRRLANFELPPLMPRVAYYEGDLSAPLLGLDPIEAISIFNTADAVIHNGADTSHLKRYFDVRACNVGSTITLARLCLPRRVPMHYVSSAGLALFYGHDAFPPISLQDARVLPPADGSLGYASSKWVSERLLERMHARYGGKWPVCIHRPSTIIRESADALDRKARLDWVHAMLYYARQSKSVPHIRTNRGALDLVYVYNACADLIRPLLQGGTAAMWETPGAVGYVHQVGDVVVPLDRLQDLARVEDPKAQPFDVLPMDVWIARAIDRGLHPAVAALIEVLNEPGIPDYPRLLKRVPTEEKE